MKRNRIVYGIAFLGFTIIEILIGIFVHDNFVRPYLGDVLVVIVIYCFIRIFFPEKLKLLSLYVFLFASIVELLQGLQIADRLGITSQIVRTMIGTVCDPKDIVCYALGCILLGIYDLIRIKSKYKGGN